MKYINTDEHRWEGYWWLPGSREKYPGTMEYSPDSGFMLHLLSEGFESPYIELDTSARKVQGGGVAFGRRDAFYDAVYGAADGKHITAFNVEARGASMKKGSQAPFGESKYNAQSVLIGAHIPGVTEACVERASVSIDNLSRWLGPSSRLSMEIKMHEETPECDRSRIDFYHRIAPGPQRGAVLADGTVIAFKWSATLPSLRWSSQSYEARITESPVVNFKPVDLWNLDDVQNYSSVMARLITLGLDKPCAPLAIEVLIDLGGGNQTAHYLIRRGLGTHDDTFASRYEPQNFTFEETIPESFIPGWFEFHDRYQTTLDLYYTMHAGTIEHFETSILLSAVLAESFHKSYFGKNKSVITQPAIDLARDLFAGDKYNRSPGSFRERMLDLYCRAPKELTEQLIPDVGKWSNGLVAARNGIVHEAGLDENIYESAFTISRVTFVLVSIHLLIAIGVPAAVIKNNHPESKLFKSAVFMTDKYLLQSDTA